MKKIKKFLFISILVIIIIITINKFMHQNHNFNYELEYDKYNVLIDETYNHNNQQYYIKILVNNIEFDLKLYGKQVSKQKIIDEVLFYDGEYKCILPLGNKFNIVDMMCYKNDIIYNYSQIKGLDKKLDEYASNLKEYNYNKWNKEESKINEEQSLEIYNDSINIFITNYKGIYSIKKGKIDDIKLFDKDIYNQRLNAFVDKYYAVLDYNEKYQFNKLYLINLENLTKEEIKIKQSISNNSYIQGIIDNKIYIYDTNNEQQTVIDINKKEAKALNEEKIKYYSNNTWSDISKAKANKIILFDNSLNITYKDFKVLTKNVDNYYFYQEQDGYYNIYYSSLETPHIIKYMCKVKTLQNIKIADKQVYYRNEDSIISYSEQTGYQLLIKNKELKFNDSIKFYIY